MSEIPKDVLAMAVCVAREYWMGTPLVQPTLSEVKIAAAAITAERARSETALLQILHDPENQPSQYGTMPVE